MIGASKIARDISDKKQMERLLLQSEKLAATGRMAAAVAHEINNPLESLMNVIFLARQYTAKESRVYELLVTAGNIAVRTEFNDLQRIPVSKGEMIQVFSNIIANAIDAMPRGRNLVCFDPKALKRLK